MPESSQPSSIRPVGGAIRPDIQALRALAILSVVVFHFWPRYAPGGFVGVDIFFVISGYLITGQLWRQVQNDGKVRFAQFWARRARRLLPVSLLVIILTALAARAVMPSTRSMLIFDEATASATYWQNWLMIFKSTDYLQQNISSLSPFQHFWSLSVEEQYYIFWPILVGLVLLVSLVLRASLKTRSWIAAGLLCLIVTSSLWASVVLTEIDQPLAYFNTFTRAWEFAGGALIAIVIDQRLIRVAEPRNRNVTWFFAGAALMLASIFLFNTKTPFPSFWAAVPTLGAMLAIFGGESIRRLMPRKLLQWRPVQFFGDISYSLYLWHWPLLVLVPIWYGTKFSDRYWPVVLVVAIALAYVSKRLIEDPIRFGWLSRRNNYAQLSITLIAVAAVVFAASNLGTSTAAVLKHSFAAKTFTPSLVDVAKDVPEVDQHKCGVTTNEDAFRACNFGDPKGTISVAMIGDSHVREYFAPLEAIGKAKSWKIEIISKSACPPLAAGLDYSAKENASCIAWQKSLKGYLAGHKKFDLIISASSSYVTVGIKQAREGFRLLVESQLARGSKWMHILDNPKPIENALACIEAHQRAVTKYCSVTRHVGLKPVDHLPEAVRGLSGVTIADFTDIYCTQTCSPVIDNVIVYRDHSHITNTFAAKLRPAFDAVLPKEFLQ
jgi:peptidoglycan/LPS O-acetylase OafA/YrhL